MGKQEKGDLKKQVRRKDMTHKSKQAFCKLGVLLVVLTCFSFTRAQEGTSSDNSQSSEGIPIDPTAVFRTMVPHRDTLQAAQPGFVVGEEDESVFLGFSGSKYTVGATISPTSTVPEAEEHIAVDPNNFNNLLTMISDFSQNGGFNLSKFAFSSTNGASWSEGFVPRSGGFPVTADGHVWQANSDPVVAIDKLGNAYLANLYLQVDSLGNVTNDGIYVCSATLGSGPKFKASGCHAVRTSLKATTNNEDKEWMAVDNSSSSFSGNVYVSWTHFTASSSMIFLSRSTNHGVTWSKPIQINLSSQNGAVQGSQVVVGPLGAVYVAYWVSLAGGKGRHFIAESRNGGTSFGTAVAMTPVFNNLNFAASYRDNSFPALAVAPVVGSQFIYDVYTDQPGTNSRTEFVHSKTPGGLTFAGPIIANDVAKGQRLMPAVAADTRGVVHLSWFDTRNSGGSTNTLDIYATYTSTNGATFAPNAKVTSAQINAGGGSFLGDYSGIAAGPDGSTSLAHPAWTSGGVGGSTSGRLHTATLTVP
jgi:hypothetical protein